MTKLHFITVTLKTNANHSLATIDCALTYKMIRYIHRPAFFFLNKLILHIFFSCATEDVSAIKVINLQEVTIFSVFLFPCQF